jgi:glycosyltransferase involved in cell wall biosynthesis
MAEKMNYRHYILKRKFEAIFIYPFIVLGKLIATIKPLKKEYQVFFFFPFYHTGGAEKVHALITQAVGNKNCIIYFTRKSVDKTFYSAFEKSNCTIKDISIYTDNKWLYFLNLIYRGIITSYINKQTNIAVVFNGQCNFGYKIAPWVNSSIKQIELIHSFNTFSWIRIPFIPFIYKTVMISKVRIGNHLEQYKKINVPEKFNYRISYICNGIELPNEPIIKDFSTPLNVLYVGRGTPEKRVNIVAKVAEKVKQQNVAINFTIVGDVENGIPQQLQQYCELKGNIDDVNQLSTLYEQAHVLLITSNTEGFPMVVMEAMAYGCAIIATPVGDLPVHVQEENGFITSCIDEEKVVDEMTNSILKLSSNLSLLATQSKNNIIYANEHFDIQLFNKKYQEIID